MVVAAWRTPAVPSSDPAASADPGAVAANQLQYFEMGGSRALVAGEWKAVSKHTAGADYDTEYAEDWEMEDVNLRTPSGEPVRITNSDDVDAPRMMNTAAAAVTAIGSSPARYRSGCRICSVERGGSANS